MPQLRIAVIGYGSIGKRHTQNLTSLNHKVTAVDLNYKFPFDVDCAFICTPTQFHIEHALEYIQKGIPVFIEKPLTYCLEELELLEKEIGDNSVPAMVGCNLRFHPSILKARNIADTKKVLFARAETGYYLPFWRKTDYKLSYSASEYGGIILDAIHEPDYLYWMFGAIKQLAIVCGKVSDLEIKKEDIAEISMLFENKVIASVHCNYLMKNYHRLLTLSMPHETITFDILPTNLMYKKEIEYFLDCVTKRIQPINGIKEATYVLRKILKAKNSGDSSGAADFNPSARKNLKENRRNNGSGTLPHKITSDGITG